MVENLGTIDMCLDLNRRRVADIDTASSAPYPGDGSSATYVFTVIVSGGG